GLGQLEGADETGQEPARPDTACAEARHPIDAHDPRSLADEVLEQQIKKRPGGEVKPEQKEGKEKKELEATLGTDLVVIAGGCAAVPPAKETNPENEQSAGQAQQADKCVQQTVGVQRHEPTPLARWCRIGPQGGRSGVVYRSSGVIQER